MNQPQEYLFVYGTLLEDRVQKTVFGRTLQGVPDTLPGFRKTEMAVLGTYPGLEPVTREAATDGYRGVNGLRISVSQESLGKADAYEGSLYRRTRLRLGSGKTAWVYLPTENRDRE